MSLGKNQSICCDSEQSRGVRVTTWKAQPSVDSTLALGPHDNLVEHTPFQLTCTVAQQHGHTIPLCTPVESPKGPVTFKIADALSPWETQPVSIYMIKCLYKQGGCYRIMLATEPPDSWGHQ